MPIYSQSAPDNILDMSGADTIITPLKIPLIAPMLRQHVIGGAIFVVSYDEPPIFDNGYDPVIARLMKMQKLGASTQQSVLLLGIDEHVDLFRAMHVDLARMWTHFGGRVEYFRKRNGPNNILAHLESTLPAITAPMQFLASLPGVDQRQAYWMLNKFDDRPIVSLLAILETKDAGGMDGVNKADARRFVGLTDKEHLIQV